MSNSKIAPDFPEAHGNSSVPITVTSAGMSSLELYRLEIATYLRELPRLLKEEQAGRYTLVKGNEILGIWDEQSEAIQTGRDRFGLEPIYVKKIDPRDKERYAILKAHLGASCPF
jgi:hypothetical protein